MATKAKFVKVLCDPSVFMLIGNRSIPVGQLTVEQAELVAAQHPGRYVEVVEKKVASLPPVDEKVDTSNQD